MAESGTLRTCDLPGADPAPARPRRPHQRVPASRIEALVRINGRVLKPHRISTRSAATTPGTGTSRWPCWRTPTCPSLRRPSRKPWQRPHPGHAQLGPPSPGTPNRPAFRPQRSPGLVHLAPAPPAPRQTRPLPAKTSPLQRSAAGVSRPKTLRSLGRPSGRRCAAAHRHAELGWPASGSGNGAGADLRDVPDRRHGQPEPGPLTMLIPGGTCAWLAEAAGLIVRLSDRRRPLPHQDPFAAPADANCLRCSPAASERAEQCPACPSSSCWPLRGTNENASGCCAEVPRSFSESRTQARRCRQAPSMP